MAITKKSNTEASSKDYWRTPKNLITDALTLLNIDKFVTDVCCHFEPSINDINCIKKIETCIEEEDALTAYSWFRGSRTTSFCNPPFSKKWEFFQKAVE